ncbi:hypothetical protein R6Q59_025273 [Mikania micrantha]
MDKVTYEGTTIATSMKRKLENEAIKSVCGEKNARKSGCEVCVGPVMMKKDAWMKSRVESSQREATTKDDDGYLKNQVNKLKVHLKQSIEKCDRMSYFLFAKFLDFESIISKYLSDDALIQMDCPQVARLEEELDYTDRMHDNLVDMTRLAITQQEETNA